MAEMGRIRRYGLRKLGDLYFPLFSSRGSDRHIDLFVTTLTSAERLAVNFLLTATAVCPAFLIRLLFICERESAPRLLVRFAGPIHIQLKGLCSLLHFAEDKQIRSRGISHDPI